MTGGFRSGTGNEALAQNSQNVLQRLVAERLQGNQYLSGLQSYAPQIAQYKAGAGEALGQGLAGSAVSLGQGQIAAGQAGQQALSGLMQLGGQLGQAAMMSDPVLKQNIRLIGNKSGHNWYSWTWNQKANDLGLFGESEGVMADEIQKSNPDQVTTRHGYLAVNYEGLFND